MKTIEEIKNATYFIVRRVGIDGGIGEIYRGKLIGSVIWSFGGGWEHVSVSPHKKSYTPSWDDMCLLKDMFFRDNECVIQYHPPKSKYVNNMPNCLHLWRPINENVPMPPSIMVGVRDGQTKDQIKKEINEVLEVE